MLHAHCNTQFRDLIWFDLIWFDLGAWEWKRFVMQLPGLHFFLPQIKSMYDYFSGFFCFIINGFKTCLNIACMASKTGANLDPVLLRPLPKWRINITNDTKLGVVFYVMKSTLRTCVVLLRKAAYHINFLHRMCPIICIQRWVFLLKHSIEDWTAKERFQNIFLSHRMMDSSVNQCRIIRQWGFIIRQCDLTTGWFYSHDFEKYMFFWRNYFPLGQAKQS